MARIYIGFDDTDDKDAPMGTGRLVREFIYGLSDEYQAVGVVRHQLPRLDGVPYTSNNSSACAIIDMEDDSMLRKLRDRAVSHVLAHCAPGSDPGVCVAREDLVTDALVTYGQSATGTMLTQQQAMDVARDFELYGLGGTNDGIIGAAAAVGLTKFGWCGRFIEYGTLRQLGPELTVGDLHQAGIQVISTDRDPLVPLPSDHVTGARWIRPSLWNGQPVLQVNQVEVGVWRLAHGKRKKAHDESSGKAEHSSAILSYIGG